MIPFIIGMNKKEMNSIKYNINTDDKIIVDIDNDIIYEGVNAIVKFF